jgi:hypothetical protein
MTALTSQMQSVLDDPVAHGLRYCILCHGPGADIGFFFPNARERRRLHITPEQMIAYVLCARCDGLPDRNRRVEAQLFAQLSVQ